MPKFFVATFVAHDVGKAAKKNSEAARAIPILSEAQCVGWAIQKGPKELKAKAHGLQCARENDRWLRRVVFHLRISCIRRVSLETQMDEVATSKSLHEQHDQE